jgi:hypothetical protein
MIIDGSFLRIGVGRLGLLVLGFLKVKIGNDGVLWSDFGIGFYLM